MDGIINQATDQGYKKVTDVLTAIKGEQLEGIQSAARDFLEVYRNEYWKIKTIESLSKAQQNMRHTFKSQVFSQLSKEKQKSWRFSEGDLKNANLGAYNAYHNNKQFIQDFLKDESNKSIFIAASKFQTILNNELSQQVKVVFTYDGGSSDIFIIDNSNEELLRKILVLDFNDNKLVARFHMTAELAKELQENKGVEKISASDSLKETYNEIIARYRDSKRKRLVSYKVGSEQKQFWISGRGDIDEAFATFILQGRSKEFENKTLDERIQMFLEGTGLGEPVEYAIRKKRNKLFHKIQVTDGVQSVDSVSGLLQGDTSVKNDETGISDEYAIKSEKASFMGIAQIRDIAIKILATSPENFNLKAEQDFLAGKGTVRNHVKGMVIKKLEDVIGLLKV